VFHFELCEDRSSIVRNVANVIDEHLVEADGAEGRFDNVRDGNGGYISYSNIVTRIRVGLQARTGIE
jgi:hypothetical protein